MSLRWNVITDILDHEKAFFQYGFQTTIWIPDHLTNKHKSTIVDPKSNFALFQEQENNAS